MTRLMEQAIARLRMLPEEKQDEVAGLLLEQLDSDLEWDRRLSQHAPELERLAEEQWAEHEAGRSEALDPDRL
jgi:hypothetical protein